MAVDGTVFGVPNDTLENARVLATTNTTWYSSSFFEVLGAVD